MKKLDAENQGKCKAKAKSSQCLLNETGPRRVWKEKTLVPVQCWFAYHLLWILIEISYLNFDFTGSRLSGDADRRNKLHAIDVKTCTSTWAIETT